MEKLKSIVLVIIFLFVIKISNAQNPISPPGVYIADPTARVWDDGKLWIYGSLDEDCGHYCSTKHHALSTSNMTDWELHKNIISSTGVKDGVPYNNTLLFAPDIMYKNGTYYLYYCQPGKVTEGVATANNPAGPFLNGQQINVNGYEQIDPSVFIDDDGVAYYLWGQFTLKMAKMNADMKTIDTSTLKTEVLNEKDHYFHEGAFMTKRNGIYYIVYADMSRADMPTAIGYATSTSPMGPYTYGGVIIDNSHSNSVFWNNHGSIAKFKNKWYVFYHRPTHGCITMRKTCAEEILFLSDGSIPEVEMTSQGVGGILNATDKIEAEWACLLLDGSYIALDASINAEVLTNLKNNSKAVYKYLDFKTGVKSITIRLKTTAKKGEIRFKLDKPWHQEIAKLSIENNTNVSGFQEITIPVKNSTGKHALYIVTTLPTNSITTVDWLKFNQ